MFIGMQRHKKWMLWFILAFVGIPLTFFGMAGFDGGGGGGNDLQSALGPPVAMVGTMPITADQFLSEYNAETRLPNQASQSNSAQEMVNNGTVDRVLDRLINTALITVEAQKYNVIPNRDYLQKKFRDYRQFKNENGGFEAGYYNDWVESNTKRGISWEAVYKDVAQGVNQKVYLDLITGSARVLESDIRQQFELQHTTMRVKYAAIEPKVDLSEEEIQAHYDEYKEEYLSDEGRIAEFVSFSLKPREPALVQELIEKANAGDDFAELAMAYSVAADAQEGGDLGWIEESEETPVDLLEIVALEPGQVSDSIEKDSGFHIYKVEEDRIREEDGVREVRARKIVIRPTLSDEEKDAIGIKAMGLYVKLMETESPDFRVIIEAEGHEVHTSGPVSPLSSIIDGIEARDVFEFRSQVGELAEVGDITSWFEAQRNIYIVRLADIQEPKQQTFEEARADVERDAIALYKNSPDYVGAMRDYLTRIDDDMTNLAEASETFPELELDIKETSTFGPTDFLFSEGIFWNTQQAFEILGRAQPGEMAGPIFDFQRMPYFLELTELIGPSVDDWKEKWEEEKDSLHDRQLAMIQNQHQTDYLQYLSEKAESEALIQKDYQVVFDLLGLGEVDTFDPHAGHSHGPLGEGEIDPEADDVPEAIQLDVPEVDTSNEEHDHSDPNHVH